LEDIMNTRKSFQGEFSKNPRICGPTLSAKGFTMVEMVVGLFLVAMIILTAMSFMVFQSRYARSTTQHRSSREAISLSTNIIETDARQAGYGLCPDASQPIDPRNLAVFMTGYKTSGADRWYENLYINWGTFLSDDPNGFAHVDTVTANWVPLPSVFDDQMRNSAAVTINGTPQTLPATFFPQAYQQTTASQSVYPFSTSLVTNCVTTSELQQRIGALIGFDSVLGYTTGRYAVKLTFNTGTNKFDLASPTTGGHYYAPAVAYTYSGDPDYAIFRNGERIIGGRVDLRVTGFRVRATFYDTSNPVNPVTGTPEWECPTHGQQFSAFKIDYLRNIMVEIRYKLRQEFETNDPELMWTRSSERIKTIVITPRALVFQASFTDLP
jgi:type II secretory pathway pseudopilin PulG